MKKKVLLIISILVFCFLFAGIGKTLRFVLTDDAGSYTRLTYHEMYEQDNIDIFFVGSSHCYRSFIPEILDEELHANTFNAGSSSQLMDGSLLLIKEAVKHNDIQHIYLEVYYFPAYDVKKERTQPVSTYIISDYLRPSVNKLIYLLEATGKEHYANSFIVARRNWNKVSDLSYIRDVLKKKLTDDYRNYEYTFATSETEWYAGKGYVGSREVLDPASVDPADWPPIETDRFSEDWKEDLEKVIDYCDRKNIPLTLVAAPMSDAVLENVGNYEEYTAYINEMIAGRDIEFYDFNGSEEYGFKGHPELFKDADHLNNNGAEKFSYLFAEMVNSGTIK